jgi:hypothetical protein
MSPLVYYAIPASPRSNLRPYCSSTPVIPQFRDNIHIDCIESQDAAHQHLKAFQLPNCTNTTGISTLCYILFWLICHKIRYSTYSNCGHVMYCFSASKCYRQPVHCAIFGSGNTQCKGCVATLNYHRTIGRLSPRKWLRLHRYYVLIMSVNSASTTSSLAFLKIQGLCSNINP